MSNKKVYLSNKDYNFIYSKSTRVCVDLLLINKDKVFMIKRGIEPYKNKWHLAGGRIRFRESISAAINRVAKSEMGIKLQQGKDKLVGFMEFPREVKNGINQHTVSLVFSVQPYTLPNNGQFFKKLPSSTHPVHRMFLVRNKIV